MTENKIEERSTLDIIEETECKDDDLEEISPSIPTNTNKFRMLCDNVKTCFFEVENSMFELIELKDTLLLQFLPPQVSLHITLIISRVYRAYSQSQVPVHELIRLVQLYSESFDMKSIALKRLYESNETKKRMLNLALQRLLSMETNIEHNQQQKSINHWEKMYIRLALPRSNVRKWKFRLKTFRENAELGYEHVIEWLNVTVPRPSSASDILSKEEPVDDENAEQPETSGENVNVPEIDEDQQRIDQCSDFGDEIRSDNEGSFLSSAGKERAKQMPQQPTVTKVDIEIQANPDLDDQQTSTDDILLTKSLIMRIYRPIGILKTKFQCIIHAQGQTYKTNVFTFDKSNVTKDENTKNKGRLAGSRITKPVDSKTKKRSEDKPTADDIDINTIDKQQCDELVIPMPSVLKRRSLFQTDIDPDAIKIDVLGDEKLCGSLILSSEDLRMLDLPNLYSPTSIPVLIIDDSAATVLTKPDQLDFDQSSTEVYQSWISRTPQSFTVYNDKRELIAKVPLHMFWYNKVEITQATKCTMTIPMEIRVPTPKTVNIRQVPAKKETDEKVISPAVAIVTDENTEAVGSHETDDVEVIKAAYEDQIVKIHANYQAEIYRLTKLLDEIRSRQTTELSELNKNTPEITDDDLTVPQMQQQRKRELALERPSPPVYRKNPPKSFLDRYHMYMERSIAHRHQLIAKVEQETALANERQMEIQHRLHRSEQNDERFDDLCLPAVFMPFRSGNVFNPRAYQFFHPVGSTDLRLTQAPSVFKLPSLPAGSVSVLNLFELSRCYDVTNEKERLIDKATDQTSN